jgi:flagellar L-ring protein precursor FlgH
MRGYQMTRSFRTLALCLMLSTSLTACGIPDRLAGADQQPKFSPTVNPQNEPGYQPVSMPMPMPHAEVRQVNSLWQSGMRSFLRDQRARAIGDILTVVVTVNDQANTDNETTRNRATTDSVSINGLFGAQNGHFLGNATPGSLIDVPSTTTNAGVGKVQRTDQIATRVGAEVVQILPNGNMVIQGKQETLINYEIREIAITGIVRPEDIANDDSITYDKVAEARITYSGRGQLMDVQQPRWGHQILDILFPF